MEQFLFQDRSESERISSLEAISEDVEKRDYARLLSQEELVERKSKFAGLAIKEAKLVDKKAEFVEKIKAEMKPITTEKLSVLTEIKTGTVQENGICYKVLDEINRMVGYYNQKGQLVDQRPMTMDDHQRVLKIASGQ